MARGLRLVGVVLALPAAALVAAAVLDREEPSAALSTPASSTTVAVVPATTTPPPKPTTTTTRPVPATTTTKAPAPAPATTVARPAPTTTVPAPATTRPTTPPAAGNTAADALALLNRDRSSAGVPALPVRSDAQAKAQAWAEKLARDNALSHSVLDQGLTQCWTAAGENVAMAGSVTVAEQILMSDPPHRAIVVAAQWTAVGVGVARSSTGSYYVVQVFVTGC